MSQTLEHAAHDLASTARDVMTEAHNLKTAVLHGEAVTARLAYFRKTLVRLDSATAMLATIIAMESADG